MKILTKCSFQVYFYIYELGYKPIFQAHYYLQSAERQGINSAAEASKLLETKFKLHSRTNEMEFFNNNLI